MGEKKPTKQWKQNKDNNVNKTKTAPNPSDSFDERTFC